MLQLTVMDLDGTLAEFNNSIQPNTIKLLQQLQNEGIQLVFISGKPASYVAGLIRQAGLEKVICIGDNGGVIWFSHDFPPHNPIILEMTNEAAKEMKIIHEAIIAEFDDSVWIQPSQVTFSLFGRENNIAEVNDFIDRIFKEKQIKHLKNFKTDGALDILPLNIDKGIALKLVQSKLNIPIKDTAVIGDGSNDFPMFLQGKIRITFPKSAELFKQLVPKIVPKIDDALKFLVDLSQFEKKMFVFTLD
ncbi:MAG: HAD family hydrolase [Promethearchaeota archaeon]